MKCLLLAAALLCLSSQALSAAEAVLPIRVKIVNLTLMSIEEAIEYCDEHGLACPAIRKKVRK